MLLFLVVVVPTFSVGTLVLGQIYSLLLTKTRGLRKCRLRENTSSHTTTFVEPPPGIALSATSLLSPSSLSYCIMRLHNALTALVASSPFLAAGIVNAKSLPVSPIEDGSTMTTTTTKTTAGQARNGECTWSCFVHTRRAPLTPCLSDYS